MSRTTSITFSGDAIFSLATQQRNTGIDLSSLKLFSNKNLHQFLSSDSSKDYTLLINSSELIYDTITIPPVSERLMPTIIKTELQRKYPELSSFSFSYEIVSDIPSDGRITRKIAFCLLPSETAQKFLDVFINHKKAVSSIVSIPILLATLIRTKLQDDIEAQLCIYDEGFSKTIFLLEHSAVVFVRHVPSLSQGLDNNDLDNISMTLDYCFQTLRVRPSRTLALNIPNCPDTIEPLLLDADFCTLQPDYINHSLPAQALMHTPLKPAMNLIPVDHMYELKQQKLFKKVIGTGIAITLVGLVCIGWQYYQHLKFKAEFSALKIPSQDLLHTLATYQNDTHQLATLTPQLKILEALHQKQPLTQTVASITQPQSPVLTVVQVSTSRETARTIVKINGEFNSPSLASAQNALEIYAKKIAAEDNLTITELRLDPTSSLFSIELEQRP